MPENLDKLDVKLLMHLQKNGEALLKELAEMTFISTTAVQKRLVKLKAQGYIKNYHAVLDRPSVGKNITLISLVKLYEITAALKDKFLEGLHHIPDVMNVVTVTGVYDYVLHIATHDMKEYEEIKTAICAIPGVSKVTPLVVLQEKNDFNVVDLSRHHLRYKKSGN